VSLKSEVVKKIVASGSYHVVPNKLYQMPISPVARMIWCEVMSNSGNWWVSKKWLKKNLRIGVVTLDSALQELLVRNMISYRSEGTEKGLSVSIGLVEPELWKEVKRATPVPVRTPPCSDQNTPLFQSEHPPCSDQNTIQEESQEEEPRRIPREDFSENEVFEESGKRESSRSNVSYLHSLPLAASPSQPGANPPVAASPLPVRKLSRAVYEDAASLEEVYSPYQDASEQYKNFSLLASVVANHIRAKGADSLEAALHAAEIELSVTFRGEARKKVTGFLKMVLSNITWDALSRNQQRRRAF
jgi:hypothetical protein